MKIIPLIVGELRANCYLVSCEKTGECLIIDPGDDANYISEKILREKLKPIAIVATHGHHDHVLAANELQMAFNIPFLIHKKDENILNKTNQSAQYWLGRKIIESPPKIDKFISQGDKIVFGEEYLKVFDSPGHTPGGICLFNKEGKILFSGDTIFANGVGRYDFSYSSKTELEESIKKIRQQFFGFHVYSGHGESFLL